MALRMSLESFHGVWVLCSKQSGGVTELGRDFDERNFSFFFFF